MKFRWSDWFRPSVLIISGLLALGAGSIFFFNIGKLDYFQFNVELTSTTEGSAQLFFDRGRGYIQEDSTSLVLKVQPTPVRYEFRLPRGTFDQFRLDPINASADTVLRHPSIVDSRGKEIVHLEVTDFTALNDVEIRQIDRDAIAVKATGNDPGLQLLLPNPIQLGYRWSELAAFAFLPACLKTFLLSWFAAGLLQTFGRPFLSMFNDRVRRYPFVTIVVISTIAVIIQCHPILFFGRSFVSPDETLLLYDNFPTLPGYISKGPQNPQGSDVGALLHASLVYPTLQREALFQYGELPLWNRYSLGGLPLLGQGQSMFGSVLNFITLFGDSSAGSWDLRYVLSRWLYAIGLGIATLLATRHLGAASAVSAVGLFIGYFGFRLNHMAQLSLDLSPWILIGWLLLKIRLGARAALLLFVANWEVMNSGTVKEAYMLMVFLNLTGALMVLFSDLSLRQKLIRISLAATVGACLVLIGAPIWMVFLDALSAGFSHYDQPVVQQAPPWQILGFFDEIFYRRFRESEEHLLPAVNFALLAGLIWTFIRAREVWKERDSVALSLCLLIAAMLAFGVIPGQWLMRVPFLNVIYHFHNTFSTTMVVLASILSGFGFKALWNEAKTKNWWKDCLGLACIVLGIVLLYHGRTASVPGSPFYWGLSCSLYLALVIGHATVRNWRKTAHVGITIVGVVGALTLTCWHHCQYVQSQFDRYVVKLGPRVSFHNHSDAVDYVSSALRKEPSRAVGLKSNVFGGFSQILRWESIYGIDPVRNRYFDRLCDTAEMRKKDWGDPRGWHEDNLPFIIPIQNLLNVRYYLDSPRQSAVNIEGLRWLASADLEIHESPGVWPRAFFTDHYVVYDQVTDFVALLRSNLGTRPFAAVERKELLSRFAPSTINEIDTRTIVPAENYQMTANTTGFTVRAPSAGLVILAENYLERDFRVFLNGKPADYFKVNETCKGVIVPSAGSYAIRFEYWPHRLNLALSLMGVGLLISVLLLSLWVYRLRSLGIPYRERSLWKAA